MDFGGLENISYFVHKIILNNKEEKLCTTKEGKEVLFAWLWSTVFWVDTVGEALTCYFIFEVEVYIGLSFAPMKYQSLKMSTCFKIICWEIYFVYSSLFCLPPQSLHIVQSLWKCLPLVARLHTGFPVWCFPLVYSVQANSREPNFKVSSLKDVKQSSTSSRC